MQPPCRYPTSWINYPPFLTATQMQQGWTRRFGTALLAANNGLPGKSLLHTGERMGVH